MKDKLRDLEKAGIYEMNSKDCIEKFLGQNHSKVVTGNIWLCTKKWKIKCSRLSPWKTVNNNRYKCSDISKGTLSMNSKDQYLHHFTQSTAFCGHNFYGCLFSGWQYLQKICFNNHFHLIMAKHTKNKQPYQSSTVQKYLIQNVM